ncbi:helix-turn-helix domain-containing protein [Vibrio harveyi]|nr:helix-turn-helix domain-containing protein [Vibrio harveyi]
MKFGRPAKLNEQICHAIRTRRTEGATIGQIAKEFDLGEATIYRALKMAMAKSD